jgi:hypothetical protein
MPVKLAREDKAEKPFFPLNFYQPNEAFWNKNKDKCQIHL